MNATVIEGKKPRVQKAAPHELQPLGIATIPDALLTVKTVAQLVGVQPRTIWLWVKHDKFPRPKRYSRRMTRWRAEEVTVWLRSRSGAPP